MKRILLLAYILHLSNDVLGREELVFICWNSTNQAVQSTFLKLIFHTKILSNIKGDILLRGGGMCISKLHTLYAQVWTNVKDIFIKSWIHLVYTVLHCLSVSVRGCKQSILMIHLYSKWWWWWQEMRNSAWVLYLLPYHWPF